MHLSSRDSLSSVTYSTVSLSLTTFGKIHSSKHGFSEDDCAYLLAMRTTVVRLCMNGGMTDLGRPIEPRWFFRWPKVKTIGASMSSLICVGANGKIRIPVKLLRAGGLISFGFNSESKLSLEI